MKTSFFLLLALLSANIFAQNNFWENPSLVDEGKEPARTYFIPYESQEKLLKNDKTESARIQMLNGRWKFLFAENVAKRPIDFYKNDLNESDWKDIQVPGSWEMQGFGIPVYTNINYIFPKNPPFVDNNDLPIGTYRYKFKINEKLKGQNIILHFGSIAGAATIYLNEQKVGYSKASKTPAEFNITPFLIDGVNQLAVQIFKWSDASYIEDQDFWRLAGIERDVYLIARPDVSLEDFYVVSDLDSLYKNGQFSADIKLRNFGAQTSGKSSVNFVLADKNKKIIFQKSSEVNAIAPHESTTITFSKDIKNPDLWSAEYPNLYFVTIELKNAASQTMEVAGCNTGFRKIEIKNKQLLINGKPIVIRGVNTHEHHEKFGHYVNNHTKWRDIQLMKQYNINAIRTSHYPQSPEVYELCDKYGMYIVDEANIEAHGLDGFDQSRHPSFVQEWKGQHLDRTIRMFERDKNHPCIVNWSLGNESNFGPNYEATYNWLKEHDKTKRPVQCDRARDNKFTDMIVPMYSVPKVLEEYAKNPDSYRPFIMCEYAHSMSNSTGNLQEYWDIIMNYPILQGGFIWDWVDQGLEFHNFEGKKYWAYGGDLGGYRWTHDENFCDNGLINADRNIHPALHEVKKVYQPIWFKTVDIEKGKISLHNYNLFTNLNEYNFVWKLNENGKQIAIDSFKIEGKPLAETIITLKLPVINFQPEKEYFLEIEALQKNATDLLPKDHVIASEQFAFPKNNYFVEKAATGTLKVTKADTKLNFESGPISGIFNLKKGTLENYSIDGYNLMKDPLRPNFWRAPTDNDFGNKMPQRLTIWRSVDNNFQLVSVKDEEQTSEGVKISCVYQLFGLNLTYSIIYEIRNDGSIKVNPSLDYTSLNLPELPRFGMKMQLSSKLENVSYYGRGPWENYEDRKTSAFIGKYSCKVGELGFDYSRPQENGYRTDVRNVSFVDSTGKGLLIEAFNEPFGFNAKNNSDEDLDPGLTKKQQHPIDVQKRNKLYLNIDYKQTGVGGNDSWGAYALDKYRLLDKKYDYSFVIKAIK